MAKRDKVVAVPDLHFPWAEYKKLRKVYDIIEDERPTHVVQLGDAWDMYSQPIGMVDAHGPRLICL